MITLADSPPVNRAWLESIPCADRSRFVEDTLRAVENGEAKSFSVLRGGVTVGVILYQIFGDVFYVLALRGKGIADPCGELYPAVEKFALTLGCAKLMFTTVRQAMVVNAIKSGWECEQIVLSKTLKK